MKKRVKHIRARPNEYVKVHRQYRGKSQSSSFILVVLDMFYTFVEEILFPLFLFLVKYIFNTVFPFIINILLPQVFRFLFDTVLPLLISGVGFVKKKCTYIIMFLYKKIYNRIARRHSAT